jgi:hypothetical protein
MSGSFTPPNYTTAQRDAIVNPPTSSLIYNTTTKQLNVYDGVTWTVGGGSSVSAFSYKHGVGTTAPPASGRIRWNNSTQASATELYVHGTTGNGVDVQPILIELVDVGDSVLIRSAGDATTYQEWTIDSIVDNTTYVTYGVTLNENNGGNISNNDNILFIFGDGGGGSVTLPIVESTGVLTGGILSTGAGASEYSISDGTGQIVDSLGNLTPVSWTGKTNITPTNLGTQLITFVGIDSGSNVIESSTRFSNTQTRTIIQLGVAVHVNLTSVDAVNNEQHLSYNALNQLSDLVGAIGFFNVSGNVFSANGTNLNIDKSVGDMFALGSNYINDIDDPHQLTLPAIIQASFQYRFSDGSNGVTGIAIDPANLDDGAGGLTALSNANKWSIQRIYSFTSNNVKIQRGVSEFDSKDKAISGISTEPYITEPSIAANGLLRGWIVCKQNASDLSDIDVAEFIEASKFQSSGAGGTGALAVSLQEAYDNSSPNPEILTDSTNGAVAIRRGSTLESDKVLVVQSGSGDDTFSVDGLGNIIATSITASTDYTNIDNVPDFVNSSETSSMTVLSSSYAVTASFALNAGGGNAYISSSGQNADLGEVTATGLTVNGTSTLSGSATVGDNLTIGYNNTGLVNSSSIDILAPNASGSNIVMFRLNNAQNQIVFGPFSDPLVDRIQFNAGDDRNEWSINSTNGTYVFNATYQDRDFIIRGTGSYEAYKYDSGITTHTFNGSDFKFSGSNLANDFDIIHLTSDGQPGMTIESTGGSNARMRLLGADGIGWNFRKNGGNFFVTQDPGNINFVKYDNTSVDYNPDGEDHNFCIIQSGSTDFAYEYDAGLATHTFTGSAMTFNGVSVIETGSGGGGDQTYQKILGSDFISKFTAAGDGSKTEYVQSGDNSALNQENIGNDWAAFVEIPEGKTATEVVIYGGTGTWEIYEALINTNNRGTSLGSGASGVTINITDTAATTTNYLYIENTTGGANPLGGRVTLISS